MKRVLLNVWAVLIFVAVPIACNRVEWGANGNDDNVYLLIEESDIEKERGRKFEYDDQNRITKITEYNKGTVFVEWVKVLSYNSAGDLISVKHEFPPHPDEGYTETFTREGNKIIIKQDGYYKDCNASIDLNAQGLPEKYLFERVFENTVTNTHTYTYQYLNSNLSEETREYKHLNEPQTDSYTFIYTYDNMKSPFYHCKTPKWFFIWWFSNEYGISNNVKTLKHKINAGSAISFHDRDYVYNYNATGFSKSKKSTCGEYSAVFKYKKK